MIRQGKELTPIPVAVITNGALLRRSDVQQDLSAADAVLPSLDAGTGLHHPFPKAALGAAEAPPDGQVAFGGD